MAENSKIEWTDHTFNPWIGCTKVGPGCDNCYAEHLMDHRLHRVEWGPDGERSKTSIANWRKPELWNQRALAEGRRYRVFCASLADVFDSAVPEHWRTDLWCLIQRTPHLDWLLLTKRIGNAHRMLPPFMKPYKNLWIGATIVNQQEADRDVPKLLGLPATVRFLSCEPMLGSITLNSWDGHLGELCGTCEGYRGWGAGPDIEDCRACDGSGLDGDPLLHWVICGGESGNNARPLDERWATNLYYDCYENEIPFFMKQGSQANWSDFRNIESFPKVLRVREFPVARQQETE